MKCWINGDKCLTQRGDDNFGLLNVSDIFCQECHVLSYNLQKIGRILEKMDRMEMLLGIHHIIGEENQFEIIEYKDVIIKALNYLKKKQDQQPDDKSYEKFGVVPKLVKLFEGLIKDQNQYGKYKKYALWKQ